MRMLAADEKLTEGEINALQEVWNNRKLTVEKKYVRNADVIARNLNRLKPLNNAADKFKKNAWIICFERRSS